LVLQRGGVLRGAALRATQQLQTLERSFVAGPIDSVLNHRRMQSSRCYIVADEAAILAENRVDWEAGMFAPGRGKNQYDGRNGRRRYRSLSCGDMHIWWGDIFVKASSEEEINNDVSTHTKTTIMALADKVIGISLFLQRDSHWHRQRKNRFISDCVRAPPGGTSQTKLCPLQDKIYSSHRSVVRCWPWLCASHAGREEVINHEILIIKGTKVDLAVRQLYL